MPRSTLSLLALAVLSTACSDSSNSPSGGTTAATSLQSVTIAGPSTAHPDGTFALTFNGSMMTGMEQYVDLHQGDVSGPLVPMTCTMNTDRTMIACVPDAPLTAGQPYTLHVGAGMMGSTGRMVSMAAGTGMGGTWMTTGMMGGHAGSMMGSGWQDTSGHAGMLFPFTAT